MKCCLLLCLATIVVCQARRIPRIPQHPYFPNFQHVYQPRNYPNELVDQHIGAPFFGNYRTQEENTGRQGERNTGREEGVGQDYYDHRIPIESGQANFVHPFAGVPFDDIPVNNPADFRGRDANAPHQYERFNHALNYNHQL